MVVFLTRKGTMMGWWNKLARDYMSDEKKYVLVKTISTFEHTYILPLEEELSIKDHLDYITCNEVEETSQAHVDECILPNSVRAITEKEAIEIFDRENDYLKDWSLEQKKRLFGKKFKEDWTYE